MRSRAKQSMTTQRQSKAEQSKADQCKAEHCKAAQSNATLSKAKQSKAERSKAEQSTAKQSTATQSDAKQSKQSRAKQSPAEQSSAVQREAGHGTAEQSRAERSRAGLGRAKQSRVGNVIAGTISNHRSNVEGRRCTIDNGTSAPREFPISVPNSTSCSRTMFKGSVSPTFEDLGPTHAWEHGWGRRQDQGGRPTTRPEETSTGLGRLVRVGPAQRPSRGWANARRGARRVAALASEVHLGEARASPPPLPRETSGV